MGWVTEQHGDVTVVRPQYPVCAGCDTPCNLTFVGWRCPNGRCVFKEYARRDAASRRTPRTINL